MGQIHKSQLIDKGEDYGDGQILQVCLYNSVSETLSIKNDDETLTLSVHDFEMLISLVNECLQMKGGHLIEKLMK